MDVVAIITRCRTLWVKFNELLPLLSSNCLFSANTWKTFWIVCSCCTSSCNWMLGFTERWYMFPWKEWTVHRVYFRIQGKHPTSSKRASYLGNTIWRVSPRLLKIESIRDNWFKQVFQFHTHLYGIYLFLQFLISSWRFWEYLIMVEREIQVFFTFMIFKKLTEMLPPNFKIHGKNFIEIL